MVPRAGVEPACPFGQRIDKLAFRDYLRAHSNKAAAYGELKRRIAAQYRFDNIEVHACEEWFCEIHPARGATLV